MWWCCWMKITELTLSPSSPGRPGIPRSPWRSRKSRYLTRATEPEMFDSTGQSHVEMFRANYLQTRRSDWPRRSRRTLNTQRTRLSCVFHLGNRLKKTKMSNVMLTRASPAMLTVMMQLFVFSKGHISPSHFLCTLIHTVSHNIKTTDSFKTRHSRRRSVSHSDTFQTKWTPLMAPARQVPPRTGSPPIQGRHLLQPRRRRSGLCQEGMLRPGPGWSSIVSFRKLTLESKMSKNHLTLDFHSSSRIGS